LNQFTVVD